MKDSRRRLLVLSLVYLLVAGCLLAYLGRTMVVQHEDWLRRSYTNRWAFRDVPTKRGSVRDRRGELLVFDRPTSALEIHYREFRRRHPCGAALHLANLSLEARGSSELSFSPASIRASFEICVKLPFGFLRDQEGDRSRDIRFYLTSFVAALTAESRYRVGMEIRSALNAGDRGVVIERLGLETAGLRGVFERRLAELEEIAALLRPKREFWKALQSYEEKWLALPRSEHVARRVFDGLEYADARRIAQRGERHPGLRVRPSVARQRGTVEARWESLAPRVGHATAEWADEADKLRRARLLAEMTPELAAMAEANDDLPEHLRPSVTERLQGAMASHLISEGRVGRSGIELDQDAVLRGNAGMHWVLRGRRRRDIGLWSTFDVTSTLR